MVPMTPITPLEGDVEMFLRSGMQPLFPIDTALINRQSLLSVVPEVESPATILDARRAPVTDNTRPMSEITEIYDELGDIEDDVSDFEEDSDETFDFDFVRLT